MYRKLILNNHFQSVRRQNIFLLLMFLFVNLVFVTYAQNNEDNYKSLHFSGAITATSNGISLIPSFSLGKPALIFDLSMGGEKFSFEPQFRMSMEGKPWSTIFWFRYKLANNDNFKLRVGAHPALMFTASNYTDEGTPVEVLKVNRFAAMEIAPTIPLTKHISFTPYYLFGHGFDPGLRNSHYLSMMASFSDLGITEHVHAGITPQVFYLKMDENHGYYFASSFSLSHDKCPISLGAMFNKKIQSGIESKDFLWNISVIYSFGNKYRKL